MTDSARTQHNPVIELEGYSFQYRAQSALTLHNISLRIHHGERVAIIGASGSGKSTLVKAINGLIPHRDHGTATGHIRVAGKDPAHIPLAETARNVGTVLQDTATQFVALSVAEDIAFTLENQQVPQSEMPQHIARAAAMVGIENQLDASPFDLSGGQKQRVAMAGVLVDDVSVLLFDEPLANLDPASGRQAMELIDRLHREHGMTVIIVEHRLEDVLHRDVDRIVLMHEGRIIADASPADLLASDLLTTHGIRPPLHVAALALAGVPIHAGQNPCRAEDIALTENQTAALRAWVTGDAYTEPSADELAGQSTSSSDAPPALELRTIRSEVPTGPDTTREILHGVSLRIERGEMVGVLGANGAGKSTLARIIAGFEKPSHGQIFVHGEDATGWPLAQRGEKIAYVLQDPEQMISRPMIIEEIAMGLVARGLSQEEIDARTHEVLDICGLLPYRTWPVSALSHGQKKRLTIASALALRPEVLILDEPTAGQDFRHYTEFMDFLRSVNAAGTTVVLITHDMHLALEYTERVLVIHDGTVLADDHPARVLTNPALSEQADLALTGLYPLAERTGITPADALVRRFIAADRATRASRAAAPDDAMTKDGGASA